MSAVFLTTTVCFIASHMAPAEHFSAFIDHLKSKHEVDVFAKGPGLKKLQEKNVEKIVDLDLLHLEGKDLAIETAKKCSRYAVVITDIGDRVFALALHKALKEYAPRTIHILYYENAEDHVPGGYSSLAAELIDPTQKVFFANSRLKENPIYGGDHQEIQLPFENRFAVGYYPIEKAESIASRRELEKKSKRQEFFSQNGLEEKGQTLIVYAGANNEAYFKDAFPSFLKFLSKGAQEEDLSHVVILLQQHPGAKAGNRDKKLVDELLEKEALNPQFPKIVISGSNTDEAQVIADAILYYQTTMAPQFLTAGIPVIQVEALREGHIPNQDILLRNNLCKRASSSSELLTFFKEVRLEDFKDPDSKKSERLIIEKGLGMETNWKERLEEAIQSVVSSS